MTFSYSALRRFPDVEAPNLQAWDATDELLVQHALATDLSGHELVVVGDEYGAITLGLTDAGRHGVRVHQDSATGRLALARNAHALELTGFVSHELEPALLRGARLVLVQLPKALAALDEMADAVARWSAPDVVLVAGGRVKHMTLAQNDVLTRSFTRVQPQRAERKSRLIVASGAQAIADRSPFPVAEPVVVPGLAEPLVLCAHGGAFAGARLDIGTRVLLDVLADAQLSKDRPDRAETAPDRAEVDDSEGVVHPRPRAVLDLGCGTGALAAWYALLHPSARVTATDRSAAAVASARQTMIANGVADRVAVTHDDAGAELPEASADLILLNPPFHLGASVHTGAATRLFEASARLLKPGGELLTVYNSSLGYRADLTRFIGETVQLRRTPKFTVTRSVRR
ncbi:methyltransferase [Microbacterium sp.]|uniref:class I SAM-dependent methyltransferase n=1 Tax=Microbacterium sp. TaxID=51671 RepID=UPI00262F7705|nr:methyltransferase [Microbacterium sp.]